jgi:hypothetical protein
LRLGDKAGLCLALKVLITADQVYGISICLLYDLKNEIFGGNENSESITLLKIISGTVQDYAEGYHPTEGLKWLAALLRLAVSHHIAFLIIAAQPFHLPPEVAEMIQMKGSLNLESLYME